MKKLIPLPILLLCLACMDSAPVQPELDVSRAMGPVRAGDSEGDAGRTVPFKGQGDFHATAHTLGCEGSDGNLAAHGAGTVDLTHLGLSQMVFVNCWKPLDAPGSPFPFEFLSQSGTLTSADGDELYWYGSAPEAGITFLTATSFSMGPFSFIGGSGRFASAQGEMGTVGTVSEDLVSGTIRFEGRISSVGSGR